MSSLRTNASSIILNHLRINSIQASLESVIVWYYVFSYPSARHLDARVVPDRSKLKGVNSGKDALASFIVASDNALDGVVRRLGGRRHGEGQGYEQVEAEVVKERDDITVPVASYTISEASRSGDEARDEVIGLANADDGEPQLRKCGVKMKDVVNLISTSDTLRPWHLRGQDDPCVRTKQTRSEPYLSSTSLLTSSTSKTGSLHVKPSHSLTFSFTSPPFSFFRLISSANAFTTSFFPASPTGRFSGSI